MSFAALNIWYTEDEGEFDPITESDYEGEYEFVGEYDSSDSDAVLNIATDIIEEITKNRTVFTFVTDPVGGVPILYSRKYG